MYLFTRCRRLNCIHPNIKVVWSDINGRGWVIFTENAAAKEGINLQYNGLFAVRPNQPTPHSVIGHSELRHSPPSSAKSRPSPSLRLSDTSLVLRGAKAKRRGWNPSWAYARTGMDARSPAANRVDAPPESNILHGLDLSLAYLWLGRIHQCKQCNLIGMSALHVQGVYHAEGHGDYTYLQRSSVH